MAQFKCIFFDLDHTLWDYETNSAETLFELYNQHTLFEKGVDSFPNFLNSKQSQDNKGIRICSTICQD